MCLKYIYGDFSECSNSTTKRCTFVTRWRMNRRKVEKVCGTQFTELKKKGTTENPWTTGSVIHSRITSWMTQTLFSPVTAPNRTGSHKLHLGGYGFPTFPQQNKVSWIEPTSTRSAPKLPVGVTKGLYYQKMGNRGRTGCWSHGEDPKIGEKKHQTPSVHTCPVSVIYSGVYNIPSRVHGRD